MTRASHTWDRWRSIWWRLIYGGNIVACTALAVATQPRGRVPMLIVSALLLALDAIVVGRWSPQGRRPIVTSAYILASMGLAIAGTFYNPIYLSIAGVSVGQIFMLLPMRWALPHVVLLTALMSQRMIAFGSMTGLVLVVLSMVFAGCMGLYITSIIEQSQERARWIGELEATRHKLAEAEREKGAHAERQRVSREIHDTLTQDLIGIVRILETAEDELPAAGADAARASIGRALRSAKDGLVEARRLVWSMRPPLLERGTLAEALRDVVERFRADTGVAAELVLPDPLPPLPLAVEVTLLRAVQEALQNVTKHARATAVTVTLAPLDDCIMLDVQDDGRGFVVPAEPSGPSDETSGGFGLVALRERVGSVGGAVSIESAPGEGTTIGVQLPLPAIGGAG